MNVADPESRIPTPKSQDQPAEGYCRQVEAYLCRKNDGHLIRIVGPAFEQVCRWAKQGVPLNVVFRGVDRYFERYYAKGPRRRPVRIEFCEADVLDVFDEWRRAVGLGKAGWAGESVERVPRGGSMASPSGPAKRGRDSLPAHLERVVARLTAIRGGDNRALETVIDDLVRELDAALARAKGLRGAAREAFLERLRALDGQMLEAALGGSASDTLEQLAAQADLDLAPFRARLSRDAYERSRAVSIDQLLRERARLPTIAFE